MKKNYEKLMLIWRVQFHFKKKLQSFPRIPVIWDNARESHSSGLVINYNLAGIIPIACGIFSESAISIITKQWEEVYFVESVNEQLLEKES